MNVEFVLLTDTSKPAQASEEAILHEILETEHAVIAAHRETEVDLPDQGVLFSG